MKLADIKPGEDYVYGTQGRQGSYQRVKVIEVGKHAVLGGGYQVPAALISVIQHEYNKWVSIRSILMSWAEYEAQKAAGDQARLQNNQTMTDRVRKVVDQLGEEMGVPTGTLSSHLDESRIYDGYVMVRVEFLERLVSLLADPARNGL